MNFRVKYQDVADSTTRTRDDDWAPVEQLVWAEAAREAYQVIIDVDVIDGWHRIVQFVLSEDGNTIYFHPRVGWLHEPLVKYEPKTS